MVLDLINDRVGEFQVWIRLYCAHGSKVVARLARVKLALALDLVKENEVRYFLVGYGPVFHRPQVNDLPIHDEVAFLIHIVFRVLVAGDLCFESEVLQRCLDLLVIKVELLLTSLPLQLGDRWPRGCWLWNSLIEGLVDRILLRYKVIRVFFTPCLFMLFLAPLLCHVFRLLYVRADHTLCIIVHLQYWSCKHVVSRSLKGTFLLLYAEYLRVLLITYQIIIIVNVIDADSVKLLRTYQDRAIIIFWLGLRRLLLKCTDHADLGLFCFF